MRETQIGRPMESAEWTVRSWLTARSLSSIGHQHQLIQNPISSEAIIRPQWCWRQLELRHPMLQHSRKIRTSMETWWINWNQLMLQKVIKFKLLTKVAYKIILMMTQSILVMYNRRLGLRRPIGWIRELRISCIILVLVYRNRLNWYRVEELSQIKRHRFGATQ